ncbi:MAG: hypothetical protein ACT4QG_12955 [Sporichthyaceae bacterium]
MNDVRDHREELSAPNRKFGYRHMIPIVQLLMRRGHLPIGSWDRYGFVPGGSLITCHLTYPLTEDDWAAVVERFVIPENIIWWNNVIRDQVNRLQIQGDRLILDVEGEVPIEEWAARQDWSGLPPH